MLLPVSQALFAQQSITISPTSGPAVGGTTVTLTGALGGCPIVPPCNARRSLRELGCDHSHRDLRVASQRCHSGARGGNRRRHHHHAQRADRHPCECVHVHGEHARELGACDHPGDRPEPRRKPRFVSGRRALPRSTQATARSMLKTALPAHASARRTIRRLRPDRPATSTSSICSTLRPRSSGSRRPKSAGCASRPGSATSPASPASRSRLGLLIRCTSPRSRSTSFTDMHRSASIP